MDGQTGPRLPPASGLCKPSSPRPESVNDGGSAARGSNMVDMLAGKNVTRQLPLVEMQLALRFAAVH